MKKGWEIMKLGEVCDIVNGGTPDTKVKEYWDGEYLWITPKDMGKLNSIYVDDTERKITDSGLNNSSAKVVPVNSVILSSRAPIGHLAINQKPISTNQGCKGLVPKGNINVLYLYYFLKNSIQFLNDLGTGTTFKELSGKKLAEVNIPVPSLAEQQRIVAILDEAFAAIDQAKENVQRNLQNAKELFQSELNSIFTKKGEGWEEKTLAGIALIFGRGKSKHRPRNDKKLFDGDYPFIQTGDVRNSNKYITTYTQTYNEIGLAQSKLWPKGTICITIAANIAETGILTFKSCFPDSIIGLVVDSDKADVDYTYFALNYLKVALQKLGKGSAQDNINLGTFENQTFPFPKIEQQKFIVNQLNTLLSESTKLEALYQQKLDKLEELKKSILQKAFTGELTKTNELEYDLERSSSIN
jgi:type I restriction enzyme, S subunit